MTNRFVNPRPQFFDASGDPLVKGRMFFFESGTAVNKPVFADVNEKIAAPVDGDGAVPLAGDGRVPEIFFSGTARVVLQNKPIEPNFIQVWDIDGVGSFGSGAAFDAWNSIVEYESGSYVVGSDGLVYKSLQNNNSNNDPISSPAFWEQVSFLRTWNPNITYALGDGGVVASDGFIYTSLQAANTNNDPVSSPTFWAILNPFDQSLNTDDNVEFADLLVTGTERKNGTHPAFEAHKTVTSGSVTGDGTLFTVIFDSEELDQGGDYNTSTGVFTAPVDGFYSFTVNVRMTTVGAGHTFGAIELVTTLVAYGPEVNNPASMRSSGNIMSFNFGTKVFMDANDTAFVRLNVDNSTKSVGVSATGTGNRTHFSGHLAA